MWVNNKKLTPKRKGKEPSFPLENTRTNVLHNLFLAKKTGSNKVNARGPPLTHFPGRGRGKGEGGKGEGEGPKAFSLFEPSLSTPSLSFSPT